MAISLKAMRINKGYTTQQVADLMNMTRQSLWNCEKNPKKIKVETLQKFCEIYDCSFDDIFLG